MPRPDLGFGMRHVALAVRDLPASEHFYVELLGMQIEWRPDSQNLYLTSGGDNLALHQARDVELRDAAGQRLDHFGFLCATPGVVDEWFAWLAENGVPMRTEPRDHRDGARSFYCYDPDAVVVQFMHHPPVTVWEKQRIRT